MNIYIKGETYFEFKKISIFFTYFKSIHKTLDEMGCYNSYLDNMFQFLYVSSQIKIFIVIFH